MRNTVTAFLFLLLFAFVTFAQETKLEVKSSVNSTNGVTATTYDFTTGSNKYYGGTNGATEVQTGVWGMIAGDANGDGGVFAEDYTAYQTNQGNEGYLISDFNMDGGVFAEDYTLYQVNQGKETQVP